MKKLISVISVFDFMDKLAYHYFNGFDRTEGIQTTLIEYLSREQYHYFCEKINKVILEDVPFDNRHLFVKSVYENPIEKSATLTDRQIKDQWNFNTLIKTLKETVEEKFI